MNLVHFRMIFVALCMIYGWSSPIFATSEWKHHAACMAILKKSYSSNKDLQDKAQSEAEDLAAKLKPILETYVPIPTETQSTLLTQSNYVYGLRVLALTKEKEWAKDKLRTVATDRNFPLLCRLMGFRLMEWSKEAKETNAQLSRQFLRALEATKLIKKKPKGVTPFWKDKTINSTPIKVSLTNVIHIYCKILEFWGQRSSATKKAHEQHIRQLSNKAISLVLDPDYAVHDRHELCCRLRRVGYDIDLIKRLISQMVLEFGCNFKQLSADKLAEYCPELTNSALEIVSLRLSLKQDWSGSLDNHFCRCSTIEIKNDALEKLKTVDANTPYLCFSLWMLEDVFGGEECKALKKKSFQKMQAYLKSNLADRYNQFLLFWCKLPVFLKNPMTFLDHYPQFFYFPFFIWCQEDSKRQRIESEFRQLMWDCFLKSEIKEEELWNACNIVWGLFEEERATPETKRIKLLIENHQKTVESRALEYLARVGTDTQFPFSIRLNAANILSKNTQWEQDIPLDLSIKLRAAAIKIIKEHPDKACDYLKEKKIGDIKEIPISKMITDHTQLEMNAKTNDPDAIVAWAVDNVAWLAVSPDYSIKDSFGRWHALHNVGCRSKVIFIFMDHMISIIRNNFNTYPADKLPQYCQSLTTSYEKMLNFRDGINTKWVKDLEIKLAKQCATLIKEDLQNKLKTLGPSTLIYCFSLWMLEELFKGEEFKGLKEKSSSIMKEYFKSKTEDRYDQFILLQCMLPVFFKHPRQILSYYSKFFFVPFYINPKQNSVRQDMESKFVKDMRKGLNGDSFLPTWEVTQSTYRKSDLVGIFKSALKLKRQTGEKSPFNDLEENAQCEAYANLDFEIIHLMQQKEAPSRLRVEAAQLLKKKNPLLVLETVKKIFDAKVGLFTHYTSSEQGYHTIYNAALIIVELAGDDEEKRAASEFIKQVNETTAKKNAEKNANLQNPDNDLLDDL